MKTNHVKTIVRQQLKDTMVYQKCYDCQTSCQSACKTSCTVSNQICPLTARA